MYDNTCSEGYQRVASDQTCGYCGHPQDFQGGNTVECQTSKDTTSKFGRTSSEYQALACATCEKNGNECCNCAANKFDSDGLSSNGCESSFDCSGISVASGSCTACSSSTVCTAISCDSNTFDVNDDVSDGCEVGLPTVADGTCERAVENPVQCIALSSCSANKFDSDRDVSERELHVVDVLVVLV